MWAKLLGEVPVGKVLHEQFDKERSSIIREATYDPNKEILVLCFHGPRPKDTYTYFGVSSTVGTGLFEAAKNKLSLGKYFTSKVKNQFSVIKKTYTPREDEKEDKKKDK